MYPAAAIDVGSNAVRMLVATQDGRGELVPLESHREPIRLGGEVFSVGEISGETTQRLALAFARFRQICDRLAVKQIRAVATSAMREARNSAQVLREIERHSGIRIEIIPGEEEARLGALAVMQSIKPGKKPLMLIDIGGGSMEISIIRGGAIVFAESLKMGTVRLLQLLESRKRGAAIFARLAAEYVEGARRQLKGKLGKLRISLCAGCGGNIDSLGELRVRVLKKKSADHITKRELADLGFQIASLTLEERHTKLGLRPDRADVIVPAIILLQNVLAHSKIDRLLIPGVGLKEGVALDLLRRRTNRSQRDRFTQARIYALEVGERFNYDASHGAHVAKLALQLFDQLTPIHSLGAEERSLLEISGLLHDIGEFISHNDHHKHSSYLLSSVPLVGLSPRDRQLISLVARYHRKSTPKSDHEGFSQLGTTERYIVCALAALLRIAEALDAQHRQLVKRVTIKVKRGKNPVVLLRIPSKSDLSLEEWAVSHRSDLFQQVFETKLELIMKKQTRSVGTLKRRSRK